MKPYPNKITQKKNSGIDRESNLRREGGKKDGKGRNTERGALIDTFKGNKSCENEDKGQQESK